MHLPDPQFPPLLNGHGVKAPEQPLDVACAGAIDGTLSAGDVVWSRNTAHATAAIVLEPDVAIVRAREMLVVLQLSLIEALALLMPSQTALQIGWPKQLLCNGAIVGGTALVEPETADDAVPDWLIASFDVRLTRNIEGLEPGVLADESSLAEEDGMDVTRTAIVEQVAAHFNANIHRWEQEGFRQIVDAWIGRVLGERGSDRYRTTDGELRAGTIAGLGDDLSLMVKPDDGAPFASPYLPQVFSANRGTAR
ncbi:MAG: biotin/lipoate--protein ligase family protein [Pseudomonadota bacterium]